MNFLDRLLGRRPDPTKDWPTASGELFAFDLKRKAFGSLAFGDSLDAARFFGRPSRFEWTQPDYCTLLYAPGGFQIDFEAGRFAALAFFLGPDAFLPSHPDMAFSQPRLGNGVTLTPATSKDQLQSCFGSPESVDTDEDETILFFAQNGMMMEFEYDTQGALKRCNLYPKE